MGEVRVAVFTFDRADLELRTQNLEVRTEPEHELRSEHEVSTEKSERQSLVCKHAKNRSCIIFDTLPINR